MRLVLLTKHIVLMYMSSLYTLILAYKMISLKHIKNSCIVVTPVLMFTYFDAFFVYIT